MSTQKLNRTLRNKFDAERTGDQHLIIEQSKSRQRLLEPLIVTQEHVWCGPSTKATQGRQPAVLNYRSIAEAPLSDEPPFPNEPSSFKTDLNSSVNDTNILNSQDMKLDLPSMEFENKQETETSNQIRTEGMSLGWKLGKNSDTTEKENNVYRS